MKAIEENKLSTTDRINIVIKRHFNKYFKQHYITKNMNEWSALRRSLKKLISLEVRLKQSQIEQLQKENDKLVQTVAEWTALAVDRKHEINNLKERIEELERGLRDTFDCYANDYGMGETQANHIEQLQKENEKERKGRERLRNIYAEKLTENIELKERTEELENLCAEAMGEQDKSWRNRFKQLLNKQN